MELTEVQLFILGLVATVIVWLVKVVRARAGKDIPSGWLTTGVYVVSFVLALLFGLPALPAWPAIGGPVDFVAALLQWVNDFLINVGPIVALATLLYNALLKKVLDRLV